MANYANLKSDIAGVIRTNNNEEITGDILQEQLLGMVDSLGAGFQYKGVATLTPATSPGTPDENVFYIASEAGTYTNFGGLSVAEGEVAILKWNGSWAKEVTGAATAAQVTQLGQEVDKLDDSFDEFAIPGSDNLLNPATIEANCYYWGGVKTGNSSYAASDYIPVQTGDVITKQVGKDLAASRRVTNMRFVDAYDSDKNSVFASSEANVNSYTVPSGIAFIRISDATFADLSSYKPCIFSDVDEIRDYEQYSPASTKLVLKATSNNDTHINSLIDEKTTPLSDSIGKDEFIQSQIGETEILSGNESALSPTETLNGYYDLNTRQFVSENAFVFRKFALTIGKYYKIRTRRSGGGGVATIVAFKGDKVAYLGRYPDDTYFFINSNYFDKIGLNGSVSSITQYDSAVINYPFANPAISLCGKDSIRATAATLTPGGTLSINNFPQFLKNNRSITFSGKLSAFDDITIGFGSGTGLFQIKVDGTSIYVILDAGSPWKTYAHGLTISDFINISLIQTDYQKFKVIVASKSGIYVKDAQTSVPFECYGTPSVTLGSVTSASNVELRATSNKFRKPIWVVGDSYMSLYSQRWTMQMIKTIGIDNFLILGKAGAGSSTMFGDLEKALTFGTPKYLLWCLGMNDTYSAWSTTIAQVESICAANGIELLLQTIPIPNLETSQEQADINTEVKASGYRYIDACAAMCPNNTWPWYADYCADGVHPTELGAKVLATRVLSDFPEIAYSLDTTPN